MILNQTHPRKWKMAEYCFFTLKAKNGRQSPQIDRSLRITTSGKLRKPILYIRGRSHRPEILKKTLQNPEKGPQLVLWHLSNIDRTMVNEC